MSRDQVMARPRSIRSVRSPRRFLQIHCTPLPGRKIVDDRREPRHARHGRLGGPQGRTVNPACAGQKPARCYSVQLNDPWKNTNSAHVGNAPRKLQPVTTSSWARPARGSPREWHGFLLAGNSMRVLARVLLESHSDLPAAHALANRSRPLPSPWGSPPTSSAVDAVMCSSAAVAPRAPVRSSLPGAPGRGRAGSR